MRYFLNEDTGVVHLRSDFPQPRKEERSQCGRWLGFWDEINKPTQRHKVRLCERCKQLAGIQ